MRVKILTASRLPFQVCCSEGMAAREETQAEAVMLRVHRADIQLTFNADVRSPLAQAAVSVQNPPSGSQTCFPGGWVR